eukprot:TRINITY_DN1518_c0_g1_i1.p1 TRINITY_DN1518_c0_g1~~TRINITY_DN1518_c0_g1_i1.p1  ORF type:complete len:451 (-),score=103.03 TRINITY_DN1518_c0_g1_i1:923-2275(-)
MIFSPRKSSFSDQLVQSRRVVNKLKTNNKKRRASKNQSNKFIKSSPNHSLPPAKRRKIDDTDTALNPLKEPYSGLNLRTRLLSLEDMDESMQDRKMIKLSNLINFHSSAKKLGIDANTYVDGDWVTIAVLGRKSNPKNTKSKEKYSIWDLYDLNGISINLFLFGSSFDEHWSLAEGSVIIVYNSKFLSSQGKQGFALSVQSEDQLIVLGVSEHYGICDATRKDGRGCTNIINKSMETKCAFHIKSSFQNWQSKRMELNDIYSCPTLGLTSSKRTHLSKGRFELSENKAVILGNKTKSPSSRKRKYSESENSNNYRQTGIAALYAKQLDGEEGFETVEERLRKKKAEIVSMENNNSTGSDYHSFVHPNSHFLYDIPESARVSSTSKKRIDVIQTDQVMNNQETISNKPEQRIGYKCAECKKITLRICDKLGHHIQIVPVKVSMKRKVNTTE